METTEEKRLRQVGFLTKGGGLNEAAWVKEEEKKGFIAKEFPGHYEFYVEEKVKK